MGKRLRVYGFLILTLLAVFWSSIPAQAAGENDPGPAKIQKEIEEMLVCQDSCGMLVSACDNSTAEYMRGIIKERLAKGEGKDEVLQYFVGIYGEKVLAAPPAKKFNILAWVTPFLAILVGGLFIYTVLDKWVFYNRLEDVRQDAKDELKEKVEIEQYQDQLNQELKKFW
ncbi:MAG: cytochrome c-type biogenesis protein CcmH [Clostridia bacterium]|nr:cytochrome c-type biogenesis protein CcmH [Clostridia bacterium]